MPLVDLPLAFLLLLAFLSIPAMARMETRQEDVKVNTRCHWIPTFCPDPRARLPKLTSVLSDVGAASILCASGFP